MNKTINHLYTDDNLRSYKLNYDLIIEELSKKNIVDKKLLKPNWKHNLVNIIDSINKNLDKLIGININLSIELSDGLIKDSEYIDRTSITRIFKKSISDKNNSTVLDFVRKLILIARNIDVAIMNSFSSRAIGRMGGYYDINFSDPVLSEIYGYLKKFIDRREIDENFVNGFISEDMAQRFLTEINTILKKKTIHISIDGKYFIRRFLEKIDIYSELAPTSLVKDDFIDKFKEIRKNKNDLSQKFFKGGIVGIFLMLLLNITFFIINYGKTEDIYTFVNNFLGNGIYIFFVEIFILIISVYSFKIYNFYSKLVELYDSHISLIESDFHYQSDPQLSNNVDPDLVFHLRKENTQKIHNLPDKALHLLNLKTDISTTSDFAIKIIEKIIDKK